MPNLSAASATLNRSASLIASLLNSAVYFLFSFGIGFLLMDHLWSKFTQFLRCPIFAEGITKKWINDADMGVINNQPISAEAQEYAAKVKNLMSKGYKPKPLYSTVTVPKPNETRL